MIENTFYNPLTVIFDFLRISPCTFHFSFSLLFMSTLVFVGEVSTSNGFATVPAAMQELSQPSPMGLSDLPRQMGANPLIPREPDELVQVGRDEQQRSNALRGNTIKSSPWGVQVKMGAETIWLDPAEDEGWDQAEEILEVNPQCFEQRLPSGKGLLDRLPLPSWKIQAQRAVMDRTEPPYLKVLSRLLSLRLASIFSAMAPPPSPTTPRSWVARGALTLHSMNSLLEVALSAALYAAREAVGDAAKGSTRNAADYATWIAGIDSALCGALVAFEKAARYSHEDVASVAASRRARAAAWGAATGLGWANITEATREAITQLDAQSCGNAPPTAGLIGRTAYRSAELAFLISMLKQVKKVVQIVFAELEDCLTSDDRFSMLAHPAAWSDFKDKHFGKNENIAHFWQDWLPHVDRFVDEAARSTLSVVALSSVAD